ncbi:B3 domain-containing protein Os04g0386900-like [Primulina eburnea]|uniref:B3 domain-containing protein Os04g0386900-like n=1 Tax=Primulina eburnea TaxID=1245227 RepID=UPI003C6C5D91
MADASGKKSTRLREKSVDVNKVRFGSTSESPPGEQDQVSHLLSKHFFDAVLTKSQLQTLMLPAHMVHLLPRATVPVTLTYGDKDWNLSYRGDCARAAFDSEWRGFVKDNDLKCEDACVFELVENSGKNLKFKVHILRGDLPPEMVALVNSSGTTSDSPIVLD